MRESKKDLRIKRLENALKLAIDKLKTYASQDETALLCGYGCFKNPKKVVDDWIKEIRKTEGGESE